MLTAFLTDDQHAKCQSFLQCRDELSACAVDLSNLRQQLNSNSTDLAEKYLARDEQEKFSTFRYEKRRTEWLGGRIAAKEALSIILTKPQQRQDLIITPDQAGRPYISCDLTPVPDISISHSGDLAVAIVSRYKPCGVDIQNFTSTIIKVQERFAVAKEIRLIRPYLSEQKALTLLWTAKEALRKAFSCSPILGFKEITLSHFAKAGSSTSEFHSTFAITRHSFQKPQQVFLTIQPDYACGITIRTS